MANIALVSCHNEPNYGTMLQAYALHRVLSKMGISSEYISYQPTFVGFYRCCYLLLYYCSHPLLAIKKIIGKNNQTDFGYFNNKEFDLISLAFTKWHKKYIPCTDYYNAQTINEIEKLYSLFIVGSDQVWSPSRNISKNIFLYYFLTFVKDQNKKASYASSFGSFDFTKEYIYKVGKALSTFKYLSCRERKGSQLISDMLKREVQTVLDPTLLLNPDDWDCVSQPIEMPKKYILCYILGEKECIANFAEDLGRKNGLPVYYILTRPCWLKKSNLLTNVGPGEFISLIRDATVVCTDSFHGSIFCINYNVPFYSFTKRNDFEKQNDNSRIEMVLNDFSLLNRFINDGDKCPKEIACDFTIANKILLDFRKESMDYLKYIINNVTD